MAEITGSIRSIKKLNFKDNKTSYYIKPDEWDPMLLEELQAAISDASREVMNGRFSRSQLSEMVDSSQLILTATELLSLTYTSSARELEEMMDAQLIQLPGCEDWEFENRG